MDLKKLFAIIFTVLILLIFFSTAAFATGFLQGEPSLYSEGQAGGLCSEVPEPYKNIFTQAGEKFEVQPAFIAAIFYAGEHGSSWPDANTDWSKEEPSSAGALGPFQFLPYVWEAHKQDGNGDSVMDVFNLWDASFGAADFMASLGAGDNTTDRDKLRGVAGYYNGGGDWERYPLVVKYANKVMAAFDNFYCPSGPAIATGKWIWPVEGPITSPFHDPRPGYPHDGLDIAAARGTSIKAVDGGTVETVHLGSTDNSCGVYVKINHNNGLKSLYCHMIENSPTVNVGQNVSQGQVIGEVDSTASPGHSTGDHLHLGAILNGDKVNPMNYLPPQR